ncbi:MAG: thioredoxin-like domain-containing protein [Chthoniobacteraceae bacterium]
MKTFLLAGVCVFVATGVAFAETTETSPIMASLKGDLVESSGKKFKKFDDAQLAPVKYYGIYYSASWCGPCRAFTPDLVSWYKRNKRKYPNFELIFVSSDRSEGDMAAYMKEDKMEWPALDYDKKKSNRSITKYAGRGIPCLVLIDDQGAVLSDSYEGSNYVGPRKVLADIEKSLKANPPSAEALAAAKAAPAATGTSPSGSSSAYFDSFFKKKPAGQ